MAHISKNASIVYRSSQAFFDETLAPYHIGCGQQFFLMRIYEQPGISQFELAETGSFDKGTCARAVKKLEELGYLRRETRSSDRRSVQLYLTGCRLSGECGYNGCISYCYDYTGGRNHAGCRRKCLCGNQAGGKEGRGSGEYTGKCIYSAGGNRDCTDRDRFGFSGSDSDNFRCNAEEYGVCEGLCDHAVHGSPNVAMYSMVAGALLNCVLDPIYIFVFHWGVQGAAIATITSQIIATVILLYYFTRKGNMRLRLTHTRLNPTICKMAFSLGISSCITQLSSTILQIAMNNSLVYYGNQTSVTGDVALSAMGIVMKISMIIVSICIGIGIGAQPILGFNRGANQPKRIKRCYRLASNIATAVTTVGWAMFMLIPHIILMLFGSADANFTEFAIKAMRIFDLGVFCAGFQVTSTSYFQATGQPMKASILSSLRQLVLLIPLILLLPLHFGLDGILYAGPIADITSAVIIFFFIHHEMKKLDVQIAQESGEELGVYSEPIA